MQDLPAFALSAATSTTRSVSFAPGGFDVSEIRVPTRVSYWLRDVLSPTQHGEWLASNVPGAEAVVSEQAGHLGDPEEVVERYRWLVKPI
jgi:pimeloyl-ACP methyl ester carboxylesterase